MVILKEEDFLEVNLNSLVADYDRQILTNLYQPIVGYKAVSLYFTLLTEVDNQKINPIISHRVLFNRMQMNTGDFVDSRQLLEAVGLLKTFVSPLKGAKLYQYELYAPKTPKLFFDNTLLYGMLIKSIGEVDANKLKDIYSLNRNPEGQEITASFIEVFSPDLDDPAFRKAMETSGGKVISRQSAKLMSGFSYELFFKCLEEISQIKPEAISKKDMKEIERLATLHGVSEESAAQAVAKVYDPFAPKDKKIDFELLTDIFMDETHYRFLMKKKNSERNGRVSGDTDLAHKINIMESYSPKDYLSVLQNGTRPALSDLRLINDLSKKFNLPNCVINALVDYVLKVNDNVLSRAFAEKIAASLARENIKTTIDAMNYLKKIKNKGKRKKANEVVETVDRTEEETNEPAPKIDRAALLRELEEDNNDGKD